MNITSSSRCSVFALFIAFTAGCSSPEPTPDGTSGVSGTCLLPIDPSEEGAEPPQPRPGHDKQPWVGAEVIFRRQNSPHTGPTPEHRVTSGMKGEFRLALNPGEYSIAVHDPKVLSGKMHSPLHVKIEPGAFAKIAVDYDKMNVRDLPRR